MKLAAFVENKTEIMLHVLKMQYTSLAFVENKTEIMLNNAVSMPEYINEFLGVFFYMHSHM